MTKLLLSMCAACLIFFSISSSPPAVSSPGDAATILQISTLRMRSIYSDKATYARYTSAQLQAINPDGQLLTRAHVIAEKPLYPDTSVWEGTPRVRFIGGLAQVTGYQVETEKLLGGTIVTRLRRSELYAKEGGQWVTIATQVTIIPKNYAIAMAQPPANLAQYAGRYLWAPGMIETLSVRGGKLISTMQGSSEQLIFTAADTNTTATDLSVATFYRDSSGKVAGYTYRKADGQTLRIRKIT